MTGKLTFKDLTVGELVDIEAVGADIMGAEVSITFTLMSAMVWIAKRREDPSVTWEQVRAMGLADLKTFFAERVELVPPSAAEEAPRESAKPTSLTSGRSASSTTSRRTRSGA